MYQALCSDNERTIHAGTLLALLKELDFQLRWLELNKNILWGQSYSWTLSSKGEDVIVIGVVVWDGFKLEDPYHILT
jgi:hypothetical protein